MACTVMGNIGTTLEHLVLSEVVQFVCTSGAVPESGWIHYIDTHAMCPANVPERVGSIFGRFWQRGVPEELNAMSPFFGTVQDARAHSDRYPSHVVFAARSARFNRRRLWASLFEICPVKWPDIIRFLGDPSTVDGQQLDRDVVRGTLGKGDFRAPELWERAAQAMEQAAVKPTARVVFCDPMSYILGGLARHRNQMDSRDLDRLHGRVDEVTPTAFVLFTNEPNRKAFMGEDGRPSRATIYAAEYADLLLGGRAHNDWFMFRANNAAVFVGISGFAGMRLRDTRNRIDAALDRAVDLSPGLHPSIDVVYDLA